MENGVGILVSLFLEAEGIPAILTASQTVEFEDNRQKREET